MESEGVVDGHGAVGSNGAVVMAARSEFIRPREEISRKGR